MIRTIGFESPEKLFGGESKTNDVLPRVETRLIGQCLHEPATKLERVDLPSAIACVKEYMGTLSHESIVCINLRADGTAISYCVLAIGSLSNVGALTANKNLMQSIVVSNAAAVVLMHNHPEGRSIPSPTDVLSVCYSRQLCEMMDIELYDMLVVGEGAGITSTKELYPECFNPVFTKEMWSELAQQKFGATFMEAECQQLREQQKDEHYLELPVKKQEEQKQEGTKEIIGYNAPKMLEWSSSQFNTILPLVETRLVSKNLYATKDHTWQADVMSAYNCATEYLCTLASEQVVCINLGADLNAISYCVVGIGSANGCNGDTTLENALKSAIASNAEEIALVHNHPEGDGKPTQDDLEFAFVAAQLCSMIGRKLHDMIIVSGDGKMYSIRYNNPEYLALVNSPYEFVKEIAERGREKGEQEEQGKIN